MQPYGTGNATFCCEITVCNSAFSSQTNSRFAFGILVSKWRCLNSELQVLPDHVDKLVLTACLLHNLIIEKEGIVEAPVEVFL
jgi:hypothetical protein